MFQNTFLILDVSPGGRKQKGIKRYVCHSVSSAASLIFDCPTEISKFRIGQKFEVTLRNTLNLDLTEDANCGWNQDTESSHVAYDYLMHGKLFQIKESKVTPDYQNMTMSCNGLLVNLKASKAKLTSFTQDQNIYLCFQTIMPLFEQSTPSLMNLDKCTSIFQGSNCDSSQIKFL